MTAPINGEAWALQPLPADESLVAGGEYCDYYCVITTNTMMALSVIYQAAVQ